MKVGDSLIGTGLCFHPQKSFIAFQPISTERTERFYFWYKQRRSRLMFRTGKGSLGLLRYGKNKIRNAHNERLCA